MLAQHGLAGKAAQLRRMSREHRLAVLVATVIALSARAADDVLVDMMQPVSGQRLHAGADHRPHRRATPENPQTD
ncbi:hypothetical protein [Mycobacterium haemophilum]